MALELRRTQSKSDKFSGRPVLYVVSNEEDPQAASNETFQTKDILKNKHGAYWNKFEKRWEWTVFNEKDTDLVLKRATTAVDEANEFLQNKADKIAPLIKALNDIEEGLAQASSFVKKDDAEKVVANLRGFIKDLQDEVDERKFDEKIQDYLAFAASRRQFSLRNTLLLWIQRPTAKDARSKTNWSIVDRQPKADAQSIILFRPPLRPLTPEEKKKIEADFRKGLGVGPEERLAPADYKALQSKLKNGVPRSSNPESFIPYAVFDVEDTEPIEAGKGEIPAAPEWFSSEPNEKAEQLKDALVAAVRKTGITVDEVSPEDDPTIQGGAKGYSSGGKIVLDATGVGVGIFNTMAHEFAHEILHQTFLKIQAKEKKSSKDEEFEDLYVGRDAAKIVELQAEATAYVVQKNYGIENKTSATYLVLFRNDRKHIQEHLEVITKTANKIINMIDSEMGGESLNEYGINENLSVNQVAKMLGVNPQDDTDLQESTDQDRYEDVVFMQGDEADEPLEILDQQGEDAALEYLKQWHNPGEHMGSNELPGGSSDYTYEKDGYIMTWNPRIGYIGLTYDLHQDEPVDDVALQEAMRQKVRMQLSESILKEYSERNVDDYPWYCTECDEELQWFDVTNDETCAKCGADVVPNEEAANYTDMEPEDYSGMMENEDEDEDEGWMQCNYCSNILSPGSLQGPGQEFCGGCGASAYEPGKMWNPETDEISTSTWNESLWANIHAKRKRGEKPAKPGEDSYPDAKAWKKAQQSESEDLEYQDIKSDDKYHAHTTITHQGKQIGYMMQLSPDAAAREGQDWFVEIILNGQRSTDYCSSRKNCIDFAKGVIKTQTQNEELSEEEWEEANALLEKAEGWEECKPSLEEAEYRGRKVKLGKPMRGDVKKFKVYVKNDKGNVVKVNFGDPNMRIKKNNPERRKSFRARHNCDNPGPRTSARYWSCKMWE